MKSYKPPKHHRIKVTEEKLGRQKALGIVEFGKEVRIRIEQRQNGLRKLDAHIHELIHLADWDMPESKVIKMATYLAKGLWKYGYRKRI